MPLCTKNLPRRNKKPALPIRLGSAGFDVLQPRAAASLGGDDNLYSCIDIRM